MYTAKRNPGKFEGNGSQLLAEIVYQASLDGANRECGDVETTGYASLVLGKRFGFIVSEDSQGFVSVEAFANHTAAIGTFDQIVEIVNAAEDVTPHCEVCDL